MRKVKIVADSSANLRELADVAFASAPLRVLAGDMEFTDDDRLDVDAMTAWFADYKGKSKTSCPNPGDWIKAFGDGEDIFCVTITSGLSGSYNAACVAKQMYESEYPDRRVHVIDSLSAGPELVLIVEQLAQYIRQGLPFEEMCRQIDSYTQQTGLLFMLESLNNFAANGRVPVAVAKLAGILGIRIVGKASDKGTLEPLDKCRGQGKALQAIAVRLKESGLRSGKVRIAHCENEEAAGKLQAMLAEQFPQAEVQIHRCRGLCSYYAEKGGVLVGFEKQ